MLPLRPSCCPRLSGAPVRPIRARPLQRAPLQPGVLHGRVCVGVHLPVCFRTSTPEQKRSERCRRGAESILQTCRNVTEKHPDGRKNQRVFSLLTVFYWLFLRRSSFGVTRSVARSQRMEMRSQTDALQIRRACYFLFCWMSAA